MSEREECGFCGRTEDEGHAQSCPDYHHILPLLDHRPAIGPQEQDSTQRGEAQADEVRDDTSDEYNTVAAYQRGYRDGRDDGDKVAAAYRDATREPAPADEGEKATSDA